MVLKLRDAEGAPTLRFRLIALLVALSMLLIAAPVVLPLIHWLVG